MTTIYELLRMNEEGIFGYVEKLLEELRIAIPKLQANNKEEIETIYLYMLTINTKMLNVFLRTGDEKLLSYIEQFQSLIRHVGSFRDATPV